MDGRRQEQVRRQRHDGTAQQRERIARPLPSLLTSVIARRLRDEAIPTDVMSRRALCTKAIPDR